VSLEVPVAGVTAVLGHNGAGKSTLLKVVMGVLTPRRGTVLFRGRNVTRLRPHARIRLGMAYVPQGQQCFSQLTAGENLRLVADTRPDGRDAMDDALDTFPDLRGLLNRRAGLLSGGQRQQLAIARALVTRPALLLLDEPTEGIQPSVVTEIQEILLTLRGRMSVLLVEQHVAFALRAASRCTVLESGRTRLSQVTAGEEQDRIREVLAI
jgi:urea transport system ATP-binding protein